MIAFLLSDNAVTLFPPGAPPLTVHADHMNYTAVKDALAAQDWDLAVALGSVKSFITTVTGGKATIDENGVTYNGLPLNNYLTDRMVEFFTQGMPVAHYCTFLENIMANPSMTARGELYLFLEAANLPITEDGCFLAYKAVDPQLKDKHTHTFDNSPGQVLEMPRRDVDDNRDRTCSYGFHAAAFEYAKNFLGGAGDRMVAVKINPADVVSVPSDYRNQKLRTCRYEVMWEIPGALDHLTGTSYINTSYDPEWVGANEFDDWLDGDDEDDDYNY